jgi:hypothetical protein
MVSSELFLIDRSLMSQLGLTSTYRDGYYSASRDTGMMGRKLQREKKKAPRNQPQRLAS